MRYPIAPRARLQSSFERLHPSSKVLRLVAEGNRPATHDGEKSRFRTGFEGDSGWTLWGPWRRCRGAPRERAKSGRWSDPGSSHVGIPKI